MRRRKAPARSATRCRRPAARAECFAADLTDAGGGPSAAGRGWRTRSARLDVLVNSAAVMHRLGFEETTPEQ